METAAIGWCCCQTGALVASCTLLLLARALAKSARWEQAAVVVCCAGLGWHLLPSIHSSGLVGTCLWGEGDGGTTELWDDRGEVFAASVGYIGAAALYHFTRLDIAETLMQGEREGRDCSAKGISAVLNRGREAEQGIQSEILERLLGMAATQGLVESVKDGWRVTEKGRMTAGSDPRSMRHWILLQGEADWFHCIWGSLGGHLGSLQAPEMAIGCDFYRALEESPELRPMFDESMREFTKWQSESLLAMPLQWSDCSLLCDVGGGSGELLMAIMASLALDTCDTRALLLDNSKVALDAALQAVSEEEYGDRFAALRYDFLLAGGFSPGEERCDCAVMKGVTSDWGDAELRTIVENVSGDLMASGATLVVVDHFVGSHVPTSAVEAFKHTMDLMMMAIFPRPSVWAALFI